MAAYVIINIEVTNPEQFKEYQRLAKPTMVQYGAKLLAKSDAPVALEGNWGAPVVVLLEFESEEKAKKWYGSAEYKEAIAAREGAAHFDTVVFPAV